MMLNVNYVKNPRGWTCMLAVLTLSIPAFAQTEIDTQQKTVPQHHESPEGELIVPVRPSDVGGVSSQVTVTQGRFTSVQVNVDGFGNNISSDAANEPSIAVDPTDHNRMAIGWREFSSIASLFRQSGYAFSDDAGQTWTFPSVVRPGSFASDPVLETTKDGDFYYCSLQTGRGPVAWPCYIYRSSDGGQTWPQDVYAFGGDKAWITVDRTDGIGQGNLYMSWTPFPAAGCCPGFTFTRSTDGGLTFSTPLATPGETFSNTNTVGPDGTYYNFGSSVFTFPEQFNLVRSMDAQDPNVTPTFDVIAGVDLDGIRVLGGIPNPVGLLGQANISADHSNGPTEGNLYVLSTVLRKSTVDPADVMFARSTNKGLSWSSPIRINDDTEGNGAYQWFGTMSVAPNGRIDVIWVDTRDDATVTFSELYYSFSLDGGFTWSANELASPAFNHFLGYPGQTKLGDYYDMVSDNGGADLAWAATFNGEQDVYYTRLTPDCNTNGIADATDITDNTSDDCNGNLIPDECESQADCDGSGTLDICDVADMPSIDCNRNHVPDSCESNADCNNNGTIDICEVADNPELDCDDNDVPDECELAANDCNSTGILDVCDIIFRTSLDCNDNNVPDDCDIANNDSTDADGNGIPDECQGACCLCGNCVDTSKAGCEALVGDFDGVGTLCANTVCTSAGNGFCSSTIVLPSDLDITVPIDNRCAASDGPGTVVCEGGSIPIGAELWYEYTAPCCGLLTVSQCNSSKFDGVVAIYSSGDTCSCPANNSTLISCGDDTCGAGGGPGVVSISVEEGACYTIASAGWNGSIGIGELNLTMTCTPGSGALTVRPLAHWDVDAGTGSDRLAFGDVWADGDIAYVAQQLDNKVHFFDVSDPTNPDRFLEWTVPGLNSGASAEDVKVGDGLLFISLWADGFDGVEIVDVRDPFNPVHLTWIAPLGFSDVRNTFYDNGYLYLATDTVAQVAVIDLTTYDPDNPPARIDTALHTFSPSASPTHDLMVQDNRLYVSARNGGLLIYDVTDIATMAPVFLGSPPPNSQTHSSWPSADGRWLAVTEEKINGGLTLYEIVPNGSGVSVLLRDRIVLPSSVTTSAHHPVFVGNRLYVAWFEAGLRIFDIDEANGRLVQVASHATFYNNPAPGGFLGAMSVYPFLGEDRILVVDQNTGLHIIQLTEDKLNFDYPSGLVDLVDPDAGATLALDVTSGCADVGAIGASMFVRHASLGSDFVEISMSPLGGGSYEGIFPSLPCGSSVDYYVTTETSDGSIAADPTGAPLDWYSADVARSADIVFADDFETDKGWNVFGQTCSDGTFTGNWQRVDPVSTLFAPENDANEGAGTQCYITGQGAVGAAYFTADVDGGPFELTSPTIPTGGHDVRISYSRWFYGILYNPGLDPSFVVEVSTDAGNSWQTIETVRSSGAQWVRKSFVLSDVTALGVSVTLRFSAIDCPNAGVAEGGVDDVEVVILDCSDCLRADQPLLPIEAVATGRYLAILPPNPGEMTALKIIPTKLPAPHDILDGSTMWVGPPETVTEASNSPSGSPEPTFSAATMQCNPTCADWGSLGTVHLYGDRIVPGAEYQVLSIRCACDDANESNFSTPALITTGLWSDVVDPRGVVDFIDIQEIVKKFSNVDGAISKARADLAPDTPDRIIDFRDIQAVVEGFRGSEFPFASSPACP